MKNYAFSLLFCALTLTGCGSSGSSDAGAPQPGNPPVVQPPVVSYQSYTGAITSKSGTFAAQGNTHAEFHPAEKRLVFETAPYGNVTTVFLVESSTGWHGRVWLNAVEYAVWFWPSENHLGITGVTSTHHNAAWTVYQVVSNG